jgi:cell division septal protein FtsQ
MAGEEHGEGRVREDSMANDLEAYMNERRAERRRRAIARAVGVYALCAGVLLGFLYLAVLVARHAWGS